MDAKNAQREFYLTDLVALAADGPGAVAVRVSPLEAQGVNDQEDLSLAIRAMTRRIASSLMKSGVTLEDPERFDADEGVEVGPDTVIEPSVRLRGTTRIGAGCVIGQGSILVDTVVGDGVQVLPYCHLDRARIGDGCRVGPFARLRPEADARRGGPRGQLRRAEEDLAWARAPRPTTSPTSGDATIGAGVNVGCGTITCNYDGEKKHPTRIGDGVFVGSDSILVAPISIGKGAYVAAGSTLTEDVPAGRAGARSCTAGEQERLGPQAGGRRRTSGKGTASPCAESSGTSVRAPAWT